MAREHGVTRLADLTGLDRIGVPVWQAVRPDSRALSVHQGKGLTRSEARRGALMEAIESAHAEGWSRVDRVAAWSELPADARPLHVDDFAVTRDEGTTDALLAWCETEPLGRRMPFLVPFASVSLDTTRPGEAGIRRSSDGQAAHFGLEAATLGALRELIERDARAAEAAEPITRSMRRSIDLESIDYPWFRGLRSSFAERNIIPRVRLLPAVIPLTALFCELHDTDPFSAARAATGGAAAHEDPEAALLGAVLEAIQSRATILSGSRDDLPLAPAVRTGCDRPSGLPGLPPGHRGVAFPVNGHGPWDLDRFVSELDRAGLPQVGIVKLSPRESPVTTVKAFVPGLAGGLKSRRISK
ncbi:hypothetical protein SCH01S_01_00130 [Sphingomonas changbaiensis NBRC 104936]|uniref:YcaO domain-containing protein n=1 Tax=Sphingomonas changbaiensis NBRC 104936 TaxID=1219043 RepID=A0A0E9ML36_9SPHN|nr:YcaO-like family protein [Sphingomonas changbaiensis]GAO37850.1 hypothetical protein SCH01S_01_00130 [Sphingomonas changbaiensis NBRC 104936]